jgi:hypothetical protein
VCKPPGEVEKARFAILRQLAWELEMMLVIGETSDDEEPERAWGRGFRGFCHGCFATPLPLSADSSLVDESSDSYESDTQHSPSHPQLSIFHVLWRPEM